MLKSLLAPLLVIVLSHTAIAKDFNGLYYNTFGKATDPAIVFIHGGPGFNSYDFEATTAGSLAQTGYFVVVFDQRGQGRSQKAPSEVYNYKVYADDIKALIDKLNLKNPVLIGHSHGGPIAIHFEQYFPGVAKKIVLLSAPIYFEGTVRSMLENCNNLAQTTNNNELATASSYLYQNLVVNPVADLKTKTDLAYWLFNMGLTYCNLYNVKTPVSGEVQIKKKMCKALTKEEQEMGFKPLCDLPKDPDVAGANGLAEFLKNENYLYQNQSKFVSDNRNRFCGVYGVEDGLFTPLEFQNIRSILNGVKVNGTELIDDGVNRFQLIPGASHALYINQQQEFFKVLKSTCGI